MNWDYIAGFFDGEGSVIFRKNDIKLQFSNTDENTLNEIQKFLMCGNIRFYEYNIDKWKPQGVLVVGKYEDVKLILEKLKDRCIIKKEKILKAIEYYKNKDWHYQKIDMKQLKNLRSEGYSIRGIAKEMGINRGVVHHRLGYKRPK